MTKEDVDVPVMFGLESPDDVLATAEHFYNEWCNGGLAQFFANWHPGDVQLVPEALSRIGASEPATVVKSAIALMGSPREWGDQGRAAMIEHKTHPLAAPLWDLDGKIDSDRLWKLIEDYELKLNEAEDDPGSEDKP